MTKINENSTITLAFDGTLDNGDTFKTITEKKPLTVKLGALELPPTLESALLGMAEGESKKVRVPPEEGYGERQKILLHTLSRKSFGNKIEPKPGMILSMKIEKDGKMEQVPATVMEVTNESVVVDYNHPLAGHHLTYKIKVLNVDNS